MLRRFVAAAVLALSACTAAPADDLDWATSERLGGAFSVYSFGESPFTHAAPGLTLQGRRYASDGASAFARSRETIAGGSPADFNASTCEACHFRNGRGLSRTDSFEESGFSVVRGTAPSSPRVVRHRAGREAEELDAVQWRVARTVALQETEVELLAPVAIIQGEERAVDLRNAPAVYGLGLLEVVPDAAIQELARARPYAEFGVRGVLAHASDARGKPGRFGWKGTFSSLDAQVRSAIVGELGIPSDLKQRSGSIGFADLQRQLTDYMRLLAVPARRLAAPPGSGSGAKVFSDTGCAMCHKPTWRTSNAPDVQGELRDQVIHPFTDLLLHDMGEELRDSNGDALSRFWRTPALWGIGMQDAVSGRAGLLHDGRARNLLEAILWHGGEAAEATRRFKTLPVRERRELLDFISSL